MNKIPQVSTIKLVLLIWITVFPGCNGPALTHKIHIENSIGHGITIDDHVKSIKQINNRARGEQGFRRWPKDGMRPLQKYTIKKNVLGYEMEVVNKFDFTHPKCIIVYQANLERIIISYKTNGLCGIY